MVVAGRRRKILCLNQKLQKGSPVSVPDMANNATVFIEFAMVAQYMLGACKTNVEVGIKDGRQMEQSQLGGWDREGREIIGLRTTGRSEFHIRQFMRL